MLELVRFGWRLAGAVLFVLAVTTPAPACPFCMVAGQTLTGEVKLANMVAYGTLTNARDTPADGAADGTTDLIVEAVIKDHERLKDVKVLHLPRYLPPMGDGKYKFLVFIDVFKGKLDPYRGVAVKADSDVVKYLKGALAVANEKPEKRLRFFFDYLENPEAEVSNDAYKEFGYADYKDYCGMAKDLPADRIAGWLEPGKKTSGFRIGLYGSLLGHCGREEHAKLLRSLIENPETRVTSGVEGVLAGYVLLKPKEGWQYLKEIMQDPAKEFLFRYAALKTCRFFWDYRPDVISHKDLAEGMAPLLEMKDVADLAIEDYRKWKYWDMTDRILALRQSPVFNVNVVKRAVLRYALAAGNVASAQKYVAEQRQQDAKMVADVEELLKLDQVPIK